MAAFNFYSQFKLNQMKSLLIDFDTDTLKVSLHAVGYVPNVATHNFFDDCTNEVTGTNYSAGGATLANKAVTLVGTESFFDADDVSWSQHASGFSTARIAVLRKDTGDPATSPLIGWIDFVTDRGNTGDAFNISWNASGIFKLA